MNALQRLVTSIATMLMLGVGTAGAADFSVEPKTNDGEKWRIAYYEGGEYIDYQLVFTESIRGLMKLGWIELTDLPKQEGEQTKQLWDWLVREAKSDYLVFLPDGHYSGNWDEEQSASMESALLERFNTKHDVDLLIATGTRAGKAFANDKHDTPTMVLTASDPITSGIIKSAQDSGLAHLHATVDPGKHERQVRIFHEIMGFSKLGMAYEDSVNGRSYAAIDAVEAVARERGFEIVRCHTKTDIADVEEAEQTVLTCFDELGEKADAIYVTQQQGVSPRSVPMLAEIADRHDIPTFSQSGSYEVKAGFLVSMSHAGFRYVGEFQAETFAKVFNGARPNQLPQVFEDPPKIALNLATAEAIGFDPPIVILGAADEIF